jgi:16S rRNA (uracil1498-N3)-methyltransferase
MFHPSSESIPIRALVPELTSLTSTPETSHNRQSHDILLLVGPEGGFTGEEVELAKTSLKDRLRIVGLGDSILKTDTAFVSVVSFVKFCLGA